MRLKAPRQERKKQIRRNTAKLMEDTAFAKLEASLGEALGHARGERADLRTTELPAPPESLSRKEIIKLRELFRCSQAIFAAALNVSVKTVQAWEQGQRVPSDAALKLLDIARRYPEILRKEIDSSTRQ